jgi:predicted cation transporter
MIGLIVILMLVLLLPFTMKTIEHNLEIFLFTMGLAAATISGVMNRQLIEQALTDPINITLAVFSAGLLAKWFKAELEKSILWGSRLLTPRVFYALTVVLLGLASSIITAIIAAIILVMIIKVLPLDRKSEVRFTVLACFSIGLGAALTPIGEPLATITISRLDKDFFYLLELIGKEVIPAITIFGAMSILLVRPMGVEKGLSTVSQTESYEDIAIRSFKIYLFVMGLTFLGHGFEPLIKAYVLGLSPAFLYWINVISAILDNATLAAAEISPAMDSGTTQAVLLGLIISGGMLIPGNIPNIIAAGKLDITSKEWAAFGVPVGLVTMLVYYIVLFIV